MIDRRLVTGFGLITLPVISATIATILACGKFMRDYESQTKEREVAYRREVYRQTAEELQLHPERGIVPVIPKDHGRMRYMRPGRWGYVERARCGDLVSARSPRTVRHDRSYSECRRKFLYLADGGLCARTLLECHDFRLLALQTYAGG